MANEITVTTSLGMANGNFEASMRASGVKIDQSALAAAAGIVSVTTNVTTLSLGIVTSAGYASFRNLNTATAGTPSARHRCVTPLLHGTCHPQEHVATPATQGRSSLIMCSCRKRMQ